MVWVGRMVAVKGLTRSFGHLQAVDGISFEIARGEVLGFLGPNGSGKFTTMKMITGFLAPSAGTVEVCGRDVLLDPDVLILDEPIRVESRAHGGGPDELAADSPAMQAGGRFAAVFWSSSGSLARRIGPTARAWRALRK